MQALTNACLFSSLFDIVKFQYNYSSLVHSQIISILRSFWHELSWMLFWFYSQRVIILSKLIVKKKYFKGNNLFKRKSSTLENVNLI